MTVEVKIYGETAGEALKELSTFSVGLRNVPLPTVDDGNYRGYSGDDPVDHGATGNAIVREVSGVNNEGQTDAAPTRKRGEPSPGKTRRTKAEIEEDNAAEAAEASNIRSGAEDRTDPENADDEATQETDAADEQAEVASDELTIDDVKALAVEYQEKYGFEAVQEDGPKIFVEAVGKPPEGEPFWKFSILPTDQASLQKLATVWRKAIDLNPLKRKAV